MINDLDATTTPQIDAIHHVAECAYALRKPSQWLAWTGASWLILTITTLVGELLYEAFSGRQIDRGIVILYEFPLLIPFLSVGVWVLVGQERLRKASRGLRGIFVPGQNDARQIAPPSTIGLLLDATLAAAAVLYEDEIKSVTALLGTLLESIQAKDEIVLTPEQRQRLHELVMPAGWNYYMAGAGGVGGKYTPTFGFLRCKLRPAAIGALSFLGDSSSISLLQRFAKKTSNLEMQASALQSVEQIRERLRCGPEQMLRASTTPILPDTLLRAAAPDGAQPCDPQILLRADPASEFRHNSATPSEQ